MLNSLKRLFRKVLRLFIYSLITVVALTAGIIGILAYSDYKAKNEAIERAEIRRGERATELGFASVADMEDAATRGFETAADELVAAEAGFENRAEYVIFLDAKKRGFDTIETMQDAEQRGFSTATEELKAAEAGFETRAEYEAHLEQQRLEALAIQRGFANLTEMQGAEKRGYNNAFEERIANFPSFAFYSADTLDADIAPFSSCSEVADSFTKQPFDYNSSVAETLGVYRFDISAGTITIRIVNHPECTSWAYSKAQQIAAETGTTTESWLSSYIDMCNLGGSISENFTLNQNGTISEFETGGNNMRSVFSRLEYAVNGDVTHSMTTYLNEKLLFSDSSVFNVCVDG